MKNVYKYTNYLLTFFIILLSVLYFRANSQLNLFRSIPQVKSFAECEQNGGDTISLLGSTRRECTTPQGATYYSELSEERLIQLNVDSGNWKKYNNSRYNFSFLYPAKYYVIDNITKLRKNPNIVLTIYDSSTRIDHPVIPGLKEDAEVATFYITSSTCPFAGDGCTTKNPIKINTRDYQYFHSTSGMYTTFYYQTNDLYISVNKNDLYLTDPIFRTILSTIETHFD